MKVGNCAAYPKASQRYENNKFLFTDPIFHKILESNVHYAVDGDPEASGCEIHDTKSCNDVYDCAIERSKDLYWRSARE